MSVQEIIVEEAVAELHAATLAVLFHLEYPEIQEAAEAYWARILTRYHAVPDIQEKIEAHLADIKARAARQASDLEEGIYAKWLGQKGRYMAGSLTLENELEDKEESVLAF